MNFGALMQNPTMQHAMMGMGSQLLNAGQAHRLPQGMGPGQGMGGHQGNLMDLMAQLHQHQNSPQQQMTNGYQINPQAMQMASVPGMVGMPQGLNQPQHTGLMGLLHHWT